MGSIDKACISGFLCRLCSEMHRIVIHIYGDQGQRLCLVEKINGYLPITISPTDPLPKTICTTCLRRVEQHYDLLMRLSRIKQRRFLRVNNKPRPRVSPISSIENSEDEVYQSENESRRRQQVTTPPPRQDDETQNSLLSIPATTAAPLAISSMTTAVSLNRSNLVTSSSNEVVDDDNTGASTSAMAAINQQINVANDSSLTSSPTTNSLAIETGNAFGIVLQHLD